MSNLPGVTSLKTTDSPFSHSQQLPIAPQVRVGLYEPLPQLCGIGDQLAFAYVMCRQHCSCAFVSIMALACPEDTVLSQPSQNLQLLQSFHNWEFSSFNLASALSRMLTGTLESHCKEQERCFMVLYTVVPDNLSKG